MDPIKLLIVDDSVFMRQALVRILTCPDIKIIDVARNGKEGVDKVIQHNPDVVTMDIEMPIMNGLEALRQIMSTNPVPVIMVSTLTSEGAEATMEALSLGAIDFITKKAAFKEMDSIKEELVTKIKSIGSNKLLKLQLMKRRLQKRTSDSGVATPIRSVPSKPASYSVGHQNRKPRPNPKEVELIAIGISTGGPNSLYETIKKLPPSFDTPIVIAQHMPPYFTKSLANRLNSVTHLNVKEAVDDDKITRGTVYIAQGGRHMLVRRNQRIMITDQPAELLYKPSVDVLISSVADSYGSKAVGMVMTGMGHDGLQGIKKLSAAGGYSIAQEPDSCVISGMPKTIIDAGLADEIIPLSSIPATLVEICGVSEKS